MTLPPRVFPQLAQIKNQPSSGQRNQPTALANTLKKKHFLTACKKKEANGFRWLATSFLLVKNTVFWFIIFFIFVFFSYQLTRFKKKKAIETCWRTEIFCWPNLTFFQKSASEKKTANRGPTGPTTGKPYPPPQATPSIRACCTIEKSMPHRLISL